MGGLVRFCHLVLYYIVTSRLIGLCYYPSSSSWRIQSRLKIPYPQIATSNKRKLNLGKETWVTPNGHRGALIPPIIPTLYFLVLRFYALLPPLRPLAWLPPVLSPTFSTPLLPRQLSFSCEDCDVLSTQSVHVMHSPTLALRERPRCYEQQEKRRRQSDP